MAAPTCSTRDNAPVRKPRSTPSRTPARKASHTKSASRPKARSSAVSARLRKLEREFEAFRTEFRESELTTTAAELRSLNWRQSHEGLARLRADLAALRDRGIEQASAAAPEDGTDVV
jgi:hypothetical protein